MWLLACLILKRKVKRSFSNTTLSVYLIRKQYSPITGGQNPTNRQRKLPQYPATDRNDSGHKVLFPASESAALPAALPGALLCFPNSDMAQSIPDALADFQLFTVHS